MFTGLVEETGRVVWLRRSSQSGLQIQIAAPSIAKGARRGDSVALNGCCLTVANHRNEFIVFDLLQETLDRTNLRHLRPDAEVNLERPLLANGRLGGHFVQGHVDCSVQIAAYEKKGDDYRLDIALPAEHAHLVVIKGSMAISGISLTVAEIGPGSFHRLDHPAYAPGHEPAHGKGRGLCESGIRRAGQVCRAHGLRMLPTTTPPHFTDRDLSEG